MTALRLVVPYFFASYLAAQTLRPLERDYPYQPTPATQVQLTDDFWRPRIETNRTATVPYCFGKCEETGRVENFKLAAGTSEKDQKWQGVFGFNDSDVTKIIEGAAYCWMTQEDAAQQKYVAELIEHIRSAQQPDGYLYTLWTARETLGKEAFDKVLCRPEYDDRWSTIQSAHQLYNLGHMYEAGVAHWQATGDRALLDVCLKSADLVCATFRPGGIELPPGHEEIELGLVKLYRATDQRKYLEQARRFLELRGRITPSRKEVWGPYSQDHQPAREQRQAVGHAVRAGYFYAAMTDIAAIEHDREYAAAVDALWSNVVETQLYITGGVGAMGSGEAFGSEYELPNETAYCETCAQLAQCLWNHRLMLLHGEGKYIDVLERILYNGLVSGVSLDGKTFFYPNPLASSGQHERSPWFDCSCCPTNLCRFLPAVPGMVYAVKDEALFVNLYAAGTARIEFGGQTVAVEQRSRYPRDGRIAIIITPQTPGKRLAIKLRIPGWARNEPLPGGLYRFVEPTALPVLLTLNGEPQEIQLDAGYATLDRAWQAGDRIDLILPMPVQRVLASERVEADRGRVALQRGPLVYCVEHPDMRTGRVNNLLLEEGTQLAIAERDDLLGGVTTVTGVAQRIEYTPEGMTSTPVPLTAIPYYAWAHRGRGEMAVWLAREADVLKPKKEPKPEKPKEQADQAEAATEEKE